MKKTLLLTASIMLMAFPTAYAGETVSAKGASQYIVNLKNGDEVSSPVKIVFGLSGMGIAPAGVDKENTGHHHILLDRPNIGEGEDGADEFEFNLPADENHIHYGKGQTEAVLELTPGKHTIQLVLGDKDHIPHNPPVYSERITITVK